VAETIKDGKGFPKLLNDEMVIPFYLANGAPLKEALDWHISGCCENRLPNGKPMSPPAGHQLWVIVEMTFRQGKLKVLHDIQFASRRPIRAPGQASTRSGTLSARSFTTSPDTP